MTEKTSIKSKSFTIIHWLMKNYEKAFFFIIFSFFIARGLFSIVPDLNLFYPFLASDSYDWIANGLFLSGYDTNFSARPPGLPLVISLLAKIDFLEILPLINQLVLGGIILTFFKLTQRYFVKPIALILAAILFFNAFLANLSLYILADCYAVFFILLGSYFYLKAEDDQNEYFKSSIFLTISFFFQYALAYFLPAIALHFLIFRRKISTKILLESIIIPAFLIPIWVIAKGMLSRISGSEVLHTKLINFHADSVPFYFVNIVAVLGLWVFIGVLIGFLVYIKRFVARDEKMKRFLSFNLLAILFWVLFWVFLYDWNDRRFIVYLLPSILPFLGVLLIYSYGKLWNSPLKKSIFILLVLFLAWSSSLPYKNFFSVSTLALTNNYALEFNQVKSPRNEKVVRINTGKITLKRYSPDLNHLDGFESYKASKRAKKQEKYQKKIKGLEEIRFQLEEKISNSAKVCVFYDNNQWYRERNKFGNYLKLNLIAYPDCSEPALRISKDEKLEVL
jgi:hypothetical protein